MLVAYLSRERAVTSFPLFMCFFQEKQFHCCCSPNCPGRPRSPDKPNLAVDSSTLWDSRKWASWPAWHGGKPAGTRGQIHHLYQWKDHHQNPLQEKMEAATPKLQPVRQPPQTEQDRAGYSVQVENGTQQTYRLHIQQIQGWRVWDVPMQHRHHDCRTSTAALSTTWCYEVGHMAGTDASEDKLYGNLEELRRTAAFMRATGMSI